MPGARTQAVREKAVAALLAAPTVMAAAKKAGVGYRTLKTWLAEDAFRGQYAEARRRLLEHSLSRLQRATAAAVTTLLKAIRGDDGKLAVRAAVAVIDRALKGAELMEVEARLAALEAKAKRDELRKRS